jgi:hypothetical protein
MRKISLIIAIAIIVPYFAKAQEPKRATIHGNIITYANIVDGDTLPMSFLQPVVITASIAPLTADELQKYHKLIRNVKITYPYARQARVLLDHYALAMKDMTPAQKKLMFTRAENEINNQFGKSLKHLTKRQGLILIRLIDRETGSDSYSLVRDLRGRFRAYFYQALGALFGYDLHSTYNPQTNEEDRIIEKVIYAINTNKI